MVEITLSRPLHEFNEKKVYPDIPLTPELKSQLKKNKNSVMHKEMKRDIKNFIYRLPTYIGKGGKERIKCKITCSMIPAKPKSFQSDSVKKYKEYLKEYFKPRAKLFEQFKESEIFVYICVYLSEKRYPTNVDNIAKPIVDEIKPYFNGDRKVKVLIVEKKMLDTKYPLDDLDYLQNSMIIVVDAKFRDEFLKI